MGTYDDSEINEISVIDLKRRLLSRLFGHLVPPMSDEEREEAKEEVKRENDYIVRLVCEELRIPIEDYDPSYDEGEFNNQTVKGEAIIQWYRENPPYG
jgi:hypothetical protein